MLASAPFRLTRARAMNVAPGSVFNRLLGQCHNHKRRSVLTAFFAQPNGAISGEIAGVMRACATEKTFLALEIVALKAIAQIGMRGIVAANALMTGVGGLRTGAILRRMTTGVAPCTSHFCILSVPSRTGND